MRGPSWLALRRAQEAIQQGRFDDAKQVLEQPAAQGHRRAGELLQHLARAHVERGERYLANDDPESAWQALLAAEDLHSNERSSDRLRDALTRLGLAQIRGAVQAGEAKRALQMIGQLREHRARHPELQLLEEATKLWLTGEDLADCGDHGQALQIVERLQRQLLGGGSRLEELRERVAEQEKRLPDLLARLHRAANDGRWNETVELSEQVLTLAPLHPEARKARTRAWRSVEPVTVAYRPATEEKSRTLAEPKGEPSQSFFLWVDGVGGYLVCMGKNVSLGQSAPGSSVDVPLIADVSRMHATLCLDEEGGYVLEATRAAHVNGKPVTRAVLNPNDRITLGASCQLQFTKPVPVSNSARLEVTSGHRIASGVDAVLIMAGTLVLGPGTQSHVRLRELKHDLVLFRGNEGLMLRYPGKIWIDDQPAQERSLLRDDAQIAGEQFSFALETCR